MSFITQDDPKLLSGPLADRPDPATIPTNCIYHATDTLPPVSYILVRIGGVASWRELSAGASGGTAIARTIVVGQAGAIDSTSVATGIALANALIPPPSAADPVQVLVYPGTYVEPPMTVPTGVVVTTLNGDRQTLANIVAQDPLNDLFTMAGGALVGLDLSGVTDPTRCLVRCNSPVTLDLLTALQCKNASNGIIIENSASVVLENSGVAIDGPGQAVGVFLTVSGASTVCLIQSLLIGVDPAVLPLYPGVDPVRLGVYVTQGAVLEAASTVFRIAHNTTAQVSLLVDSGSVATVLGSIFSDSQVAVAIGALGPAAKITVNGSRFFDNVVNFEIDSSVGRIFETATVDHRSNVLVPGAVLSGIVQNESNSTTDIIGPSAIEYASGRDAPLPEFLHGTQNAGYVTGLVVTAGAGLHVNVTAGSAWVTRGAPDNDADLVDILAASLAVPANATSYVFVDAATESLLVSTSFPADINALLATVVTDGAVVRFVHATRLTASAFNENLATYISETAPIILGAGLAVTAGSTVRKFSVDAGNWYVTLQRETYPSSGGDATWSSFFGAGGSNEIAAVVNIDITNYDNAGVLTAMTGGFYRSDTVYLTSDGRISVIYGTAQNAVLATAEAFLPASAPPFIMPSGIILASLIVQQGNGIVSILDRRPRTTIIGPGTAGVTVHGLLSGLLADDHPQYLLGSGVRPMTGALNMGGNDITNVGQVNGVTVQAHAVRHQPGGADAIATAVPVAVLAGVAPSLGAAASFAVSDHQHGIATGVPSSIGTANLAGASSAVPRLDHVHAHDNQPGGSLHALVVSGGASGFMSGADKAKLDSLTASTLRQSVFAEIVADTTTGSVAFVSLLSQNITTTAGGILLVNFQVSGSNSNNNQQVIFRMSIDGVVKRGAAFVSASGAANVGCAGLLYRQAVAPGIHTVLIEWRVTNNTGRIRPVTQPDTESASLLIEEVTV